MHVELYCMEMYGNCNKSGVGVVWQTRVRGMGVGWGGVDIALAITSVKYMYWLCGKRM